MATLAPLWAGILVGGASRRMGTPKQNLVLEGRTFAERVAGALAPHTMGRVLLGAGEVAPVLEALPRIPDPDAVAGPLAGILAAFTFRPDVAWLIAACDLPLLTPDAVAWLVAERRVDSIAVLPRLSATGIEPSLAIYEPAAAPVLRALAASGVRSLQSLAQHPGVRSPQPPTQLLDAWLNVNDPAVARAVAGRAGNRRDDGAHATPATPSSDADW